LYVIKIKDTGIGMSTVEIQQLFKMFGRMPSSRFLNSRGIGLGLTFTKAIIDHLGGTIEVESEIKVGTTFSIRFPYIHNEEDYFQEFQSKESIR
jgi:signal transduction histidine kinase